MSSSIHAYRAQSSGIRLHALAVLAAASGCAGSSGSGEPSPRVPAPEPTVRPVVTLLEPSSGWAGTAYPYRVTIHGSAAFDAVQKARLRRGRMPGGAATGDGTGNGCSVPKERPRTGEGPPRVLPAGEYAVTVTTESGKSTPVTFTLTRPGNA